jgi:cytochrome c oxidase subunit IV
MSVRMENEKNHIIPYRTYLFVLAGLIVATLTSVAVTQISLGTLTVAIALFIAALKSSFVLRIFMHLKYENKMFSAAVIAVTLIIAIVIIITLLDYLFR